MSDFTRAAGVDEIPAGGIKSIEIDGERIVICHAPDGFYAVADECSHDTAPFRGGALDGHTLVCPRHGATFDVRSGEATGPPAVVGIDKYEVKIDGNDIYVKID